MTTAEYREINDYMLHALHRMAHGGPGYQCNNKLCRGLVAFGYAEETGYDRDNPNRPVHRITELGRAYLRARGVCSVEESWPV